MKKYLPALTALLLVATSCNLEGAFEAKNVQDLVTAVNGSLLSDGGAVYTVESSIDPNWNTEGARYYMVFDILNRSLDIKITELHQLRILPVSTEIPSEPTPEDPFDFQLVQFSGGYLNCITNYYRVKGSNTAPVLTINESRDEKGLLHLFFYLDVNKENPTRVEDPKTLETEALYFCTPLKERPSDLTFNILNKDNKLETVTVLFK